MENPKRARSWKRRLRPRVNLKNDVPVLYSTAARTQTKSTFMGFFFICRQINLRDHLLLDTKQLQSFVISVKARSIYSFSMKQFNVHPMGTLSASGLIYP
jgi:hypothetical protein